MASWTPAAAVKESRDGVVVRLSELRELLGDVELSDLLRDVGAGVERGYALGQLVPAPLVLGGLAATRLAERLDRDLLTRRSEVLVRRHQETNCRDDQLVRPRGHLIRRELGIRGQPGERSNRELPIG